MLPLLRCYSDSEVHPISDVAESLAAEFKLTGDELRLLLPSGRQATFPNRVAWARTSLSKTDLLSSPRRAHFRITADGQSVLAAKPARIDISDLNTFPEFVKFRTTRHEGTAPATASVSTEQRESPGEQIEFIHAQLKRDLAADVLTRIAPSPPDFCERLGVELLLRMG